jgi:protein-L-isoaspartate O-methyltransferase
MDFVSQRKRLVDNLVSEGYLESQSVIDAMLKIPREYFIPVVLRESAYCDCPIPIKLCQSTAEHQSGGAGSPLSGTESSREYYG